jgi:methylmalonyl-CoA mutase
MEQLLTEFPAHTYDQWHAAAEALLKGAPFEKLLVSQTYEGITIQPIYRQEDIAQLAHRKHFPGADSLVRGSQPGGFLKAGWEVSQNLQAANAAELNNLIHQGLNGGQSELNLSIHDATGKLTLENTADVQTALKDVAIDAISTYWQAGAASLPTAALFIAAAEQIGLSQAQLRGGFENDPLGDLVSQGELHPSLELRFDHMASLTRYAIANAPQLRTISAGGDAYHNSGATATQELASIISTLVCYLEEMKSRGLPPAQVMPHIRIQLCVGSDYFMEIAKIRATRWLWSKIANAYGADRAPVHIHASTSLWNKTAYDAHTNMLRVTSEAFAAVVGGVDSLHIGPYDELTGTTDEFSRRIARNIHTILREECGLANVIDPAGGSTYIEWLTDQIAQKSWAIFQDIEKNGGMIQCLQAGSVQEAVNSVRKAKFQNIRRRKDKIVGSNMYPDLKGSRLPQLPKESPNSPQDTVTASPADQMFSSAKLDLAEAITAAKKGASFATIAAAAGLCKSQTPATVTALKPHRAAEEYEALRDASAAFAAKTGTAPGILQLNIGPSGRYRLRADWTASFFEAAGFLIDGSRDFATVAEAVEAFRASKATIAVITSDDATYQETVVPLATAIQAAKPGTTLLVAGAPGDHESTWRAAGVTDFVNVRSNNYELNAQLLKTAGVL